MKSCPELELRRSTKSRSQGVEVPQKTSDDVPKPGQRGSLWGRDGEEEGRSEVGASHACSHHCALALSGSLPPPPLGDTAQRARPRAPPRPHRLRRSTAHPPFAPRIPQPPPRTPPFAPPPPPNHLLPASQPAPPPAPSISTSSATTALTQLPPRLHTHAPH
ncbi:Protein of unknown function, partial [Gryllus bimaculatus]